MSENTQLPIKKDIFAHYDLDAFFASVEVRFNPSLRGKPVIVGADPQHGRGRGVVSTCSYEARHFGVHSGQPISQAYKLCPQGVYISPRHRRYGEISDAVMAIIEKMAPQKDDFWQTSIDEAFLRFSTERTTYADIIKLTKHIQETINKQEQLSCSAGIAPTKIVAKIATDFHKPGGITVVYPDKITNFLAPLDIGKIPGIGKKTQAFLNQKYHLSTINQVASLTFIEAVRRYGEHGRFIWQVSHGISSSRGQHVTKSPSHSCERTFHEDTNDCEKIRQVLTHESNKLAMTLKKQQYLARTISLKIRFSDFSTYLRSFTVKTATNSADDFFSVVWTLYREFLSFELPVRLLGIKCSNLSQQTNQRITLLDFFPQLINC